MFSVIRQARLPNGEGLGIKIRLQRVQPVRLRVPVVVPALLAAVPVVVVRHQQVPVRLARLVLAQAALARQRQWYKMR